MGSRPCPTRPGFLWTKCANIVCDAAAGGSFRTRTYAKTMSTEKSVREIVEAWNTKAKAEGRYLDRDPWSIPPAAGSLLDVPETPESRERIEWLKQQIAELQRQRQDHLEQENAAAVTAQQQGVRDQVREITDPVSPSATNDLAPLNMARS